jgi:hypothetical protein
MPDNLTYKTKYSYWRGILLPILIVLVIMFYSVFKYGSFIHFKEDLWPLLLLVIFGFQMLFVSSISLENDCLKLSFPFPLSIFKRPKIFKFSSIEKLIVVKNTYGYTIERFRIILKDGMSKDFTYAFITIRSKNKLIEQMKNIGLKVDYFRSTIKTRRTKD